MIEGLGPREDIAAGDLPSLASRIEARTRAAPSYRDGRTFQSTTTGGFAKSNGCQRLDSLLLIGKRRVWRLGRRPRGFPRQGGVVRRGFGYRAHHGGPPVDLTGDKDEWAFVDVDFEDAEVQVLTHVRIGTCRKGIWGKATASPARVRDKRPGRAHIDEVSLDALEAKLKALRTQPAQPPTKEK